MRYNKKLKLWFTNLEMSAAAKEKKSTSSAPLWKKALIRQDAWDDKVVRRCVRSQLWNKWRTVNFVLLQEEFLDAIYWLRQVFSAVLGIIWGIIPLQGFIGMGMWVALCMIYRTVVCTVAQLLNYIKYI